MVIASLGVPASVKCFSKSHLVLCVSILGQEKGLPEYVVSECYGDIFNFDCGPGNKIRINRDFFGYSGEEGCRYRRKDCIISNPKSNSLIHRFCTGHRVCTYYMVERRGCGGFFSNYQQVEYQCIPGQWHSKRLSKLKNSSVATQHITVYNLWEEILKSITIGNDLNIYNLQH